MIIGQKLNSVVFFERAQNGKNRAVRWTGDAVAGVFQFRERRNSFSLDFRLIGPSVYDEARRKAVLRDEG